MQILDAAQKCFAGRGFHRTTMDDLVREAGLSKGTLYWHFDSKEAVLLGICDRYADEFFAAWDTEGESTSPAETIQFLIRQSERFMERMVEQQRELAQTFLVLLEHPVARERMAGIYRESRQRLVAAIEAGIASGEVVASDPEALAAGLTGVSEGLALQWVVDPAFDPVTPFRSTTQALLKGFAR